MQITVRDVLRRAQDRAAAAAHKFPQPNYVLLKIAEESGEVVKSGVHCAEGRDTYLHLLDECVDLIAMVIRLLEEGDQVNGVLPVMAQAETEL
jgi:hypothetical protein